MTVIHLDMLLPARRAELLLRPIGDEGRYVLKLKDPRSGEFFQIGEQEHFLLTSLGGRLTVHAVCDAYEERFSQALSEEDLEEFVQLIREQGFLETPHERGGNEANERNRNAKVAPAPQPPQNLLCWRKSLFDPDRLFTWLAPKVRFLWTRGFLVLSGAGILLAFGVAWAHLHELAGSFPRALRWETALLAWLTLFAVSVLHEAAHGLTCKHHGGEVREIGLLLLFFMPCFYCNVSDAWLFKEKSKRLWVMFAGGYFELCLWALAVFVWRLTLPGSLLHSLAFIVLTLCGVQTLFNFLPLLKLDGYYLVSDCLEIPNLQQRALASFKGYLRWLLWGGPRPESESRGKLLWRFGLATWLYSVLFLGFMLWGMTHFLGTQWSWLAGAGIAFLGLVGARGILQGISAGEVRNMILRRHKRTALWLLVLVAVVCVLLIPIEDWAGGTFHLRAGRRVEVRAPLSGFLQLAYVDEGDRASAGVLMVRLDIPDLASQLAQKQAEAQESTARLKLLESGPRPEEVVQQRQRLERAQAWRDLARQHLVRFQQTLTEELAGLDKKVAQQRAELKAAQNAFERSRSLRSKNALADAEHQEAERKLLVSQAQLEQAQAEKKARQTKGTLEVETELARRDKELADVQATLTLLEAGARPEEVDAERARLTRLQHEVTYLEEIKCKLTIYSPVSGVVTTPHLKEKVGQYFREGDLICVVDAQASLEVEITIAEQDMTRVQSGQEVGLKPRMLPYDRFAARSERIAPNATRGDVQSNVTVYCTLAAASVELRPDMSGHARIYTGRRPIGVIAFDRVLRLIRTELWW